MSERPPAPDQAARDLIRERLDVNLLVEAGAGSGKTECLARRMATGVLEGRYKVEEMAAVTFTRKAAAELRGRFQLTLERALADEQDATKRPRAQQALRHLQRLFALLADGGPRESTCSVQKRMREFARRLRVASLEDPRALAELVAEWESEPRVVQKWWPRGKADKEKVEALFTALHRDALPFLD